MGYKKTELVTLLSPEQSMQLPGGVTGPHPWLVEGKRR